MTERHDKHGIVSLEIEKLLMDCGIPAENTSQNGKKDETKRNINWMSDLSETQKLSGKTVELLVESGGDTRQMKMFNHRLDEIVHEISDQYGGILGSSSLFNGITKITLMLEPGRMSELMMRLAFLPQVEKVEEGMYYGNDLKPVDGMVGIFPYPMNSKSSNKIRVVMKEDIILGY